MSKGCIIAGIVVTVLIVLAIGGVLMYRSSYNTIIAMDENVKAKAGNLQAQYQRRLDLIPNLVEVVKGYAAHERETLEAVVKARAEATQAKLDVGSAEALQRFQNAQGTLTEALSRLMVVVERYPDLKANENFRDLQAQLEGTENRVKQARLDYNEAVQGYNSYVRGFFVNMFFGGQFPPKPYFEAEAGADKAPQVKF
jgi:LemA protein